MLKLKQLWYRLMGNTIRTDAQWRAWAIEQAVKAGTPDHQVVWRASQFLEFVYPPKVDARQPVGFDGEGNLVYEDA